MSASLAIVAGGGPLPRQLIEACRSLERPVFVVAINGETEPSTVEGGVPHTWLDVAQVGHAVSAMREAGCAEVCLIGPVRRPESFSALKPDWQGIRLLPKVVAAAREGGDDAILQVLLRHLEESGFRIVGADEVVAHLTVPAGWGGRLRPADRDRADIAKGIDIIRALGPFDIGQAVVVRGGQVLAVEAAEGTDLMLARCADFRQAVPGGVLVKCPKPQQDRRVDLPTVGPRTVDGCAAAGLAGIAVAAGQTIVVEPEATLAQADEGGLFVLAVDPEAAG